MPIGARAPPFDIVCPSTGTQIIERKEASSMDHSDQIRDFLAAVEDLRGADESVRTTAHTSSVSAQGWPAAESQADPEPSN